MTRPSGAKSDLHVPLVDSVCERSIEVDGSPYWRTRSGLVIDKLLIPMELLETFLVAVQPQGIQGWYTLDVEMPLVRLYLTPENAAAAAAAFRLGAGQPTP
jgi:hypothetical protein